MAEHGCGLQSEFALTLILQGSLPLVVILVYRADLQCRKHVILIRTDELVGRQHVIVLVRQCQ